MNLSDIVPRLRWQCRRGMLELDVLLGNFLEEAFSSLSPEDQATFVQLLECNDQLLFDWFTEKKLVEDENLRMMVQRIKEHAKNRH